MDMGCHGQGPVGLHARALNMWCGVWDWNGTRASEHALTSFLERAENGRVSLVGVEKYFKGKDVNWLPE